MRERERIKLEKRTLDNIKSKDRSTKTCRVYTDPYIDANTLSQKSPIVGIHVPIWVGPLMSIFTDTDNNVDMDAYIWM